MNICGNTCHMDCNGHRNCLMARYNWCNFGKLGLMLGFGQRKYPLLPFVIGLFTHAIFFTPAFHSQSAIPAFRDPPGPHSQLVLLIQLLQFCTHNKNHPRIADSTRESRILSATIREYCVTLSFCAQVAVSFDGYDFRPKVFKIFFYTPNYGTITGTHHLITIYHTDDFYKGNQMGCILIA